MRESCGIDASSMGSPDKSCSYNYACKILPDYHNQQAEVRKRALDLLARREHAPAELRQKLRKRGYGSDDIAAVLDALVDEDWLSTRRYAESVVNARIAKGNGPVRIRADLVRAQIDDDDIEDALHAAQTDWSELASAVRQKRFGAALPEDYKERTRQMRFLRQRGFDFDCIRALLT